MFGCVLRRGLRQSQMLPLHGKQQQQLLKQSPMLGSCENFPFFPQRNLSNNSRVQYLQTSSSHWRHSLYNSNISYGHTTIQPAISQIFCKVDLRQFSTGSPTCRDNKEEKKKEGIVPRFKQMAKDYWYVLIPVHVATSIVWFGGFYVMAKSGLDIIAILEFISVPQSVVDKLKGSEAGYYALAYACYKVATPFRYTVTVGGTTYTVSKLTDMGYLKTSKQMADSVKDKKDDLKEKYETKKDDLKEKYESKKDDMKEKYDNIKEKYEDRKDAVVEDWETAWEKFAKKKLKKDNE